MVVPKGRGAPATPSPVLPAEDGAGRGTALVLAGGGARAAYHVGVLSAIAERMPDASFPILTGVSAGAINVTYFAGQECGFREAVERMRQEWLAVHPGRVFRARPGGWIAAALRLSWQAAWGGLASRARVRGLLDLDPLREFVEGWFDAEAIDRNIAAGRLRALAVSATGFSSGRSVTFVHGASDAALWRGAHGVALRTRLSPDHLMASTAIPVLFPPVRIGGEFYGDGGVKHTSPLGPAIRLGARSVLAVGMRANQGSTDEPYGPGDYPTFAETIGLLLDSIFIDGLEVEAEQLYRMNRTLMTLPPDVPPPRGLHPVNLIMLRPSRDLAALAVGHSRLLPRRLQRTIRTLGGADEAAAGLLSYLLFVRPFTSTLIELAYEDTGACWPAIERFFAGVGAER